MKVRCVKGKKPCPTFGQLEDEGTPVKEYPVDCSQTTSNCGDALVYRWRGRYFEAIKYNEDAPQHLVGKTKISEIGG